MNWRRSPSPLSDSLFAVDFKKFNLLAATRNSLGVALPLAVGAWQHQPAVGVLASIGALYTGMAAFGGIYRARLRMMASSGFLTALATVLGVWVGPSTVLTVACLFIAGILAALYAARSPASSALGLQSCAILVVISSLGLPVHTALQNGLSILLGSLGQFVLLGIVLPFNPVHPERTAVADAIESLAHFVTTVDAAPPPESPVVQIPGSQPFQDARSLLDEAEGARWSADHDLLLLLTQRSESVRAALVGWTRAFQEYRRQGPAQRLAAHRVAVGLNRSLLSLQLNVRQGWKPAQKSPLEPLDTLDLSDPERAFKHWTRTVRRLMRFLATTLPPENGRRAAPKMEGSGLFSFLTRLPNVRSLKRVALTHAIRYATTLALADAIARWTHLSHAYWMPLTVALILRPDYATTFLRGIGRLAGTLVGVLAATVLLDGLHPSPIGLLIGMGAFAWLSFAAFPAGYQAYTVAITLFVVFSVSASHVTPAEIGLTRLLSTLGGVVLSVAAYFVWPTLHWSQFWKVLGDAVAAQQAHAEAVLAAPPRRGLESIDAARVKARGLRIQTETLLRSASLDPLVRGSDCLASATEAALHLDENAAEMLSVEAAHFAGAPNIAERMQAILPLISRLARVSRDELTRCLT